MNRIFVLALLLTATLVLAGLGQSEELIVAIDQTTGDQWEAVADSFQQAHGVSVGFQSYSQSSLPTQIVVQSYRSSAQFQLAMVPEAWALSLSRYLLDLSSLDSVLRSRGVVPITSGGRVVGVPIPFADGWFLGVVQWPADQQLAIEFLVATATGATSDSASGVRELGVVPDYGREKIARASHNPMLDGSLEALLGAAQQALGTAATQMMSALPSVARSAIEGLASLYGIPFSAATSTVTVVLESSPGRSSASNVAALSALGVRGSSVESTSTLIKITVPLSQLSDIVGKLTGVSFIRPPYTPFPLGTPSQGVDAIGAAAFHATGNRGSGVKVAIIDLGFSGLSQAQARGDLPYSVNQNDLTGTGLTSGITHGTAVAEIVHDVAPDAQLYLIKIADEVDLDLAVTYCLSNGIDIINHSLGWYNTNFYDGTGTVTDIARRAIAGGALWVNAAGNEAESHWEGTFTDGNADGWLDQTITFYTTAGSHIVQFLTWNEWPQASSDYDLYLFDPSSNLVASSTKHQTGTEEPTESIRTTAPMSGTYSIRIQGTGSRQLELFNLYQSVSPAIASSSILAPANVAEVIAVGAIDHTLYTIGPQQPYSSQGPTNDGRTKPDLCAPDNVATGTAPYTTFPGSSGAAPHASGAAALLLSQTPTLSESALRTMLLSQTIAMGSSNIYGNGRLYLQPPATSNQPPTALFSISPTSGLVADWFQFNASASQDPDGSIVGYSWQYGDGSTGTGVTSYHSYAAVGTYTARLTVTDDDGATATTTHAVTVSSASNQPPTAAFTISPTSGAPGTWFTFNAAGSQDPDGSIVSYAWQFGDGTTGTGITAYRAYASAGTFTVRLTVTDDDGATATTTRTVSISAPGNQPPTASFTVSPASGSPGTLFTFNASGSQDPDGGIASYAWEFGDGTTGTGITAYRAYASAGTFTVRLTVTDNNGASNTTTRTVVVQTAAMPDLTVQSVTFTPSNPTLGQTLTFTITVRNSGNASAGQFRVRLQGSASSTQTYVTSLASGASRTLTLSLPLTTNPETFTVTADDLGQVGESSETNNTRSTTATAMTIAVVAEAGGPYSGTVGSPVSFNGTGSSGPITTYLWSFGDGTSAQGVTTSHSYSYAGTYTVSLTVYGTGQSTDTAQVTISAAVPALAAQVSLPKTSYEVGEPITITYTTNRTAYVYLCEVDSDGRVVLLYPSWLEPANPVSAGTHTIPGSAYTLRVSEPIGQETLYLFAATSPLATFPTSFSYGFPVLSTNPTLFRNTVLTAMQALASGEWAYDDISFVVTAISPTTGTLRVLSTPSGASVRLDGSTVGTTPLEVSGVSPGTHTVQFSLSGYGTETRTVTVTAGLTTTVNIALPPVPTNQPPVASFTVSPTNPIAGQNVQFNATGSYDPDGSIASYSWSFSDGGTAFGAVVNHTFSSNGIFTVTLTVTDNAGASDTTTRQISIQVAAQPDLIIEGITSSPASPSIGSSITVSATVRNVGAASAGMFRVRLQGSASTTQTYVTSLASGASRLISLVLLLTTSPETFTLTADDLGQVAESNEGNNTAAVTVTAAAPSPPIANPDGPYSGQVGSSILFNGTGSTGSITGYSWNFGDGVSAQGATPSHAYGSPGTYTVSLTVSGPGGQSTASTQAVVSPVAVPDLAAQLSLPKGTYQVGEDIVVTVTLNRTAYVYLCDVSPDGTVVLLYPNATHSNSQLGAGEHPIPEENAPYTFEISAPTGTETLYLFAATGPIPGFPTTFGTGFVTLSDDPVAFRNSILAAMQSQFASGDQAYDTVSFDVTPASDNQTPTAAFSFSPKDWDPGTWFLFDASDSQDHDGNIVSYNWDYGDGTTVDTGITAIHKFPSVATFTVQLTVTDNDGASATTTRTVSVGAPTN